MTERERDAIIKEARTNKALEEFMDFMDGLPSCSHFSLSDDTLFLEGYFSVQELRDIATSYEHLRRTIEDSDA